MAEYDRNAELIGVNDSAQMESKTIEDYANQISRMTTKLLERAKNVDLNLSVNVSERTHFVSGHPQRYHFETEDAAYNTVFTQSGDMTAKEHNRINVVVAPPFYDPEQRESAGGKGFITATLTRVTRTKSEIFDFNLDGEKIALAKLSVFRTWREVNKAEKAKRAETEMLKDEGVQKVFGVSLKDPTV